MTPILLLKAFIISKLKYHKALIIIMILSLIFTESANCQISLDYFGNTYSKNNSHFRLNSFESNTSNFNFTKDMELSTTFSGIYNGRLNSNLYSISFSKKINSHYFYIRYTPGLFQQFVIKSGMNIQLPDSIAQLKTKLNYEEKFGLGYAFNLSRFFTLGFSVRYFSQVFTEEKPVLFYTDSVNYISIRDEITQSNFWVGNIGLTYLPNPDFLITIFSNNLFLSQESTQNYLTDLYSLKRDKGFTAKLFISLAEQFDITAAYETSNSFYTGLNFSTKLSKGFITVGGLIFHDRYQKPFFAGLMPSLNYSTNFFSITLSGINYFSNRSKVQSIDDMIKDGIHSISNNSYSDDKVFLTLNFSLSLTKEKQIKLIDVDVKNDIYPTLNDIFMQKPFAVGKVANLTNKIIEVRPSCLIKKVNEDIIYSPNVKIPPYDTVEVPYYIFINNLSITKREISQAEFFVSVDDLEPDDKIQKPVLINDSNSWDGNVSHLIYFVRSDFEFSSNYSKNLLQSYKKQLDSLASELLIFNQIKILFENFIKEMNYVADPRATVEHVQFPSETLKLKGGDCDDLSVCFASLLESIGIQTAFVDYKNPDGVSHVNLLVNTNLNPSYINLITNNDAKVVIRKNIDGKDEIWIPIETTCLQNFDTAWNIAAEKFYKEAIEEYGLSNGKVTIIDIY